MEFTLRQVRYFLAVVETGQISKAALKCHISQSAMTIALRALEDALGTSLFERHVKGLRLSAAGERFLRHAQQLDQTVERAVDDMQQEPATLSGHLNVGVTDTISAYLMPSLQIALKRRFPGLSVTLIERERTDIEQQVRDGSLDLAIELVSNAALHADIDGDTLLRSPRQLWASPDHPLAAGSEPLSLSDIARADFLLLDMDEHLQTARLYWEQHGLQPTVLFQSKSIEAIRSMVALGSGITILSDLVYRPWSLEGGRIVRRTLRDPVPTMDVGVIWSKSRGLSSDGELLRDFLRATLRDH